jgi:hypothetical protein
MKAKLPESIVKVLEITENQINRKRVLQDAGILDANGDVMPEYVTLIVSLSHGETVFAVPDLDKKYNVDIQVTDEKIEPMKKIVVSEKFHVSDCKFKCEIPKDMREAMREVVSGIKYNKHEKKLEKDVSGAGYTVVIRYRGTQGKKRYGFYESSPGRERIGLFLSLKSARAFADTLVKKFKETGCRTVTVDGIKMEIMAKRPKVSYARNYLLPHAIPGCSGYGVMHKDIEDGSK